MNESPMLELDRTMCSIQFILQWRSVIVVFPIPFHNPFNFFGKVKWCHCNRHLLQRDRDSAAWLSWLTLAFGIGLCDYISLQIPLQKYHWFLIFFNLNMYFYRNVCKVTSKSCPIKSTSTRTAFRFAHPYNPPSQIEGLEISRPYFSSFPSLYDFSFVRKIDVRNSPTTTQKSLSLCGVLTDFTPDCNVLVSHNCRFNEAKYYR